MLFSCQSATAEANNQDPLIPFMATCEFLMKTSACAPESKCVLHHFGLFSSHDSCKCEKLECSTQFSINLPSCNNQGSFPLKLYLYFLFIS